jgi:hypothetical protein
LFVATLDARNKIFPAITDLRQKGLGQSFLVVNHAMIVIERAVGAPAQGAELDDGIPARRSGKQ